MEKLFLSSMLHAPDSIEIVLLRFQFCIYFAIKESRIGLHNIRGQVISDVNSTMRRAYFILFLVPPQTISWRRHQPTMESHQHCLPYHYQNTQQTQNGLTRTHKGLKMDSQGLASTHKGLSKDSQGLTRTRKDSQSTHKRLTRDS